jgi:hypothetical protein
MSPSEYDEKRAKSFGEVCMAQADMVNPATQVMFRAGFLVCREYMARFVEAESPEIAASIRANWHPHFGEDYGAPRPMAWEEATEGEIGQPGFCMKDISPTLEALPLAKQIMHKMGIE